MSGGVKGFEEGIPSRRIDSQDLQNVKQHACVESSELANDRSSNLLLGDAYTALVGRTLKMEPWEIGDTEVSRQVPDKTQAKKTAQVFKHIKPFFAAPSA